MPPDSGGSPSLQAHAAGELGDLVMAKRGREKWRNLQVETIYCQKHPTVWVEERWGDGFTKARECPNCPKRKGGP